MPSELDETWTRPLPGRSGVLRDAALAGSLLVASVAAAELVRSSRPGVDMGWMGVEGFVWSGAIVVPLCVRRRYPICAMVACAALFYLIGERMQQLAFSVTIQAAPFMAIYAAWAWAPQRRRLKVWTALVFTGMFVWLTVLVVEQAANRAPETSGLISAPVALGLQTFVVNILYFFGAAAWGFVSWRSARQRATLRRQARELAEEQHQREQRAVADERLRIARDLHDVVAHHVSSIGVHAAGARRLLNRDPKASADALQVIEGSSRQAVQETQWIVSLLRAADTPVAPGGRATGRPPDRVPQPGVDEIATLVEQARADGLSVRFRQTGTPARVSSTVGLSMYRTAQESLANLRKHATGARAEVVLRYLEDTGSGPAVEVEVIDDGAAPAPAASDAPPGWGLVGIRERANLHGGSTEIGPRPGGGYRVRVRMPAETSA